MHLRLHYRFINDLWRLGQKKYSYLALLVTEFLPRESPRATFVCKLFYTKLGATTTIYRRAGGMCNRASFAGEREKEKESLARSLAAQKRTGAILIASPLGERTKYNIARYLLD